MKQRGKKSLKITDAIVRGDKNAYEFEVFPIETEFEPQSAVYIFSHRKTDKTGRGHQKFFCIGQTDSLDGEFTKYKKQFASKYKANVICVRIEEEENLRVKIEEELKSAYNISCSTNIEKAIIQAGKPKAVRQVSKMSEAVQAEKKVSTEKTVGKKVAKPASKKIAKTAAKSGEKAVSKKPLVKAKTSKAKLQIVSVKPKTAKQKIKSPAVNSKVIKQKTKLSATKPSDKKQKTKVSTIRPEVARQSVKLSPTKPKPAKQKVKTSLIQPKATKQKNKAAATQPAKILTSKSKPEMKKQKVSAQKQKAPKIAKSLKNQKSLNAKKVKSNGNGKSQTRQKTETKKLTAKSKKRPAERGSRKQLAF